MANSGTLAAFILLAIGLMNSIMFPTIFSLACERLGSRAMLEWRRPCRQQLSAELPRSHRPRQTLADLSGSLALSLALPAACYAVIAVFGIYARRPAADRNRPASSALHSERFLQGCYPT